MIIQLVCVIVAACELPVHTTATTDCDQLGDDAEDGDCASMLAQRVLLSRRHVSADSDYITDKVCVKNKVAGDLSFKIYTEDGKKVGDHDDFNSGEEKCSGIASTEGTELKLKTKAYWGTSKTWSPHFTFSTSSDACELVWKCSGTVDNYDCDITSGCKSTTTTTTTSTTKGECANPTITDFVYYNVIWIPSDENLEIASVCNNLNGSADLSCSNSLTATNTETQTVSMSWTIGGSVTGTMSWKEGVVVEDTSMSVSLTVSGSYTQGTTKTETKTITMNSACAIGAEPPGDCDLVVGYLVLGTMTFDWNATLNCDDGTTQEGGGTVVGGHVVSTAAVSGCSEQKLTAEECTTYIADDPTSLASLVELQVGSGDKKVCVYNGVSADIKFKIYDHSNDDAGAGGYNSWYPAGQTKCAYASGVTGDQMKVKIYADNLSGSNPVSKQWFTYDVDGGTINFKCSGTEWDISCSQG